MHGEPEESLRPALRERNVREVSRSPGCAIYCLIPTTAPAALNPVPLSI